MYRSRLQLVLGRVIWQAIAWLMVRAVLERPVSTVLSVYAIGWGIILLAPTNTFGRSPSYASMAALFPENVWGISVVILGVAQFYGAVAQSHRVAVVGTFFSILLWLLVCAQMTFSNYITYGHIWSHGVWTYLWYVCLSLYAYLRLANAKPYQGEG